jgi:tetratricopeptide (TPR) repeat protein
MEYPFLMKILFTWFTAVLFSFGLNTEMARANLLSGVNIQIDRSISNDSDESTTNDRDRCMELIQLSLSAYEQGNHQQEIEFYKAAIQCDQSNGWGFLLYATTTDDSTEIIPYLEHAIELFEAANETDGLEKAKILLNLVRS